MQFAHQEHLELESELGRIEAIIFRYHNAKMLNRKGFDVFAVYHMLTNDKNLPFEGIIKVKDVVEPVWRYHKDRSNGFNVQVGVYAKAVLCAMQGVEDG